MSPAPPVDPRTIPDSPPAAVLDQIAAAAKIYDRLLDSGRELRLELHPVTGRLHATLAGPDGAGPVRLSATDVIDLAAGEAAR